MKAAIYLRVSTTRKAASIDWQDLDKEAWREIVLGFCERINLNGRTVAIAWNDEALALRRVLAAATVVR